MKKGRKPIGKKLRFEVFKRDGFKCQYCGNNPPNVILEIDHIKPINKNGNNNIDNLITSCFDCNRGKGKNELSSIPVSLIEKTAIIREKEQQYNAYISLLKKIEKRKSKELSEIDEIYSSFFTEYKLTNSFLNNSVRKFINELGVIDVKKSIEFACYRVNDSDESIKYFCGICWGKIKKFKNEQ